MSARAVITKFRSFIGRYITREDLIDRIRGLRKAISKIHRGTFLETAALSLTFAIALGVRLFPLRWGFYLSEFDPYLQWRMSDYIVKNGFLAWFNWHDYMSWWPEGMRMSIGNLYGVAFTIAALYFVLNALGINATVFQIAVLFPPVAGALTAIAVYFFAKDSWGRSVGLLSSLFLALNPSNISRTTLGFLRHEALGILLMVLFFLFFQRAISKGRGQRASIVYSVLAGLTLFYLAASWAAFYYPMDLVVLYVAVLAILGRYSRRLLISYSVTYGLFLLLTTLGVPKIGFSFLDSITVLVIPGVAVLLLAREVALQLRTWRARILALAFTISSLSLVMVVLAALNIISLPAGKFISTLNPFARLEMPIVQSVAEHRPATWASFFFEFSTLTFLGLFGFYFAYRKSRDADTFLILFGLTSLYFASSLVRLTLILAPGFVILAAIATTELAKPAVDILRQAVIFPKRRVVTMTRIGREFGAAILLILIIAIVPTFSRAVNAAYTPATIVTSSIPTVPESGQELRYQDWLQALSWMRENTPSDAVIFAWWDYGYWITALGQRRTLADNGTQNTTQIATIAQTFLVNQSMALPTLRRYNVTYVAVFVTFQAGQQGQQSFLGYGEDGKWYWMARIGNGTRYQGQDVRFFEKRTETAGVYYRTITNGTRVVSNETITEGNDLKDNTLLGLLIKSGVRGGEAKSPYFKLAFSSSNRFVLLYEVEYALLTNLTLELSNSTITYGESVRLYGNLTDEKHNRLAGASIELEGSLDGGETWDRIERVQTDVNGTYSFEWWPDAGSYLVRATYSGARGKYIEATSLNKPLEVKKATSTATIELSATNVTLGKNVTITVKIKPALSEGNVTLQYSADNVTWTTISTKIPVNGSVTFTWAPPKDGEFYVRATWQGTENYAPVTTKSVILSVKKQ